MTPCRDIDDSVLARRCSQHFADDASVFAPPAPLVLLRAREPLARWARKIEPGTSCTAASAIDLGGEPA